MSERAKVIELFEPWLKKELKKRKSNGTKEATLGNLVNYLIFNKGTHQSLLYLLQ
jgi:hypothetical protein